MTIEFIGTRQRDFTVNINGNSYYVQPGQQMEVAAEDGRALIERDPHLWQVVTQADPEILPEPPRLTKRSKE